MSLLYPLGLLGLLAIPVLIIIYIIKSKYTEQVVASTYLWTLSEKFLKRKNPINKITGIISLILQILAVIFISIALAHPVFTLPGKANDYCFILDGSASMNVVEGGETRFENGKERIEKMISSAADGSTFTLITTGNTTEIVMKENSDKKSALLQLEAVKPAQVASDFNNAITEAQKLFDDNTSCKFYLITDKDFEVTTNVELINVAGSVQNYALSDVEYAFTAEGGITVTGKAYTYGGDAQITVDVYYDDARTPAASQSVSVTQNVAADFTVECDADEGNFQSLRVTIRQRDNLSLDNSVILYNMRNDAQYKTLIVSSEPFFVETTLEAVGAMQKETVAPEDYNEDMKGYALYVFDSFTPAKMPADGAVWFINPDASVEGSGFSRRGVETLAGTTQLRVNTSSSTRVKNLLKGTVADKNGVSPEGVGIGVTQYVKCGLYRSFTTLMSCNGDPVIFAGTNSYGNREVVFALDFRMVSDIAVAHNARVVTYNLIDYTFPALVDETNLFSGEALSVNVLANCTGIRVESPSGKAEYLDTSDAISEYELTEVGEYKIIATIGNSQQTARVFSQLPMSERILNVKEASFVISGEAGTQKRDGRYEDLLYAFIILAVIVVADWVVYCYEQYQLR